MKIILKKAKLGVSFNIYLLNLLTIEVIKLYGLYMKKYILKRLLLMLPTFFGVTIVVYFLMSLAPGSPMDAFLSVPGITEAELLRIKESLGLDKPVFIQYYHWLINILQGNFGYSFSGSRPVTGLIMERVPATLMLGGASLILSFIIAVPLGLWAAARWRKGDDYVLSGISFFLMSVPNFFIGLILIYLVSVKLKLLPSSGMYDASGDKTVFMLAKHMVLPCVVLSMQNIGSLFKQMRGSLLEVLHEDYMRAVRAKGLSKNKAILKYGIKNAFIPVLTVIAGMIPGLIGGAVVTEQLFGWQGLGMLIIAAIKARDYPVIMGITVLTAVVVLVVNLISDILYSILDPRING